jgi:hypothetical protein
VDWISSRPLKLQPGGFFLDGLVTDLLLETFSVNFEPA